MRRMETLQIKKTDFGKILDTADQLIDEVENVLSQEKIVSKRIQDIKTGKVKGKTEDELENYLKGRGLNWTNGR